MKRFFISKENISNDIAILDGEEHLHLSKVLRIRTGEQVEVFYEDSKVFVCEILEIGKSCSKLKILSYYDCPQNPKTDLTLFQGMPKLDKLETVCQKLNELGIKRVVPFISSFCVAKESANKINRINKIIVSSAKQCGRTNLLKLDAAISFDKMLESLKAFDQVIFAYESCEENEQTLQQTLQNLNIQNKRVAYIIGSEGGFSSAEAEQISSQKNVATISLGKRILRTETASVAIGAILQNVLGEF